MTDQEKQLQDAVYSSALTAAQAGEKPTYAGTFEGKLNDIFTKIENREPFSYNVNADPFYQSYKDQYIQGGKLAMKDTMGQAAALTGGYGNTYGQQVGQQAYNAYLQNLSAVIPELYDRAYGVYKDEGDDLKDQFALAGAMRDDEYGRYRDNVGDWEYAQKVAAQREQEDYERRIAEEQRAKQWQQQAYTNLVAMIKASGATPTDDQLAEAGMTRADADALRNEFNRQVAAEEAAAELQRLQVMAKLNGSSGSSGGGGGGGGGYYTPSSGFSSMDGYYDNGGDGLWHAYDTGGSGGGSYYDQVRDVAVELAHDAGANRTAGAGTVYNGSTGTAPIIQAVMSNTNLSNSQKATIREEVVNAANANVNRSAMGSPTAYYTPGVNMGGTGANQFGQVVSSKPVQDYTKRR